MAVSAFLYLVLIRIPNGCRVQNNIQDLPRIEFDVEERESVLIWGQRT
jgi:hypothetical protein